MKPVPDVLGLMVALVVAAVAWKWSTDQGGQAVNFALWAGIGAWGLVHSLHRYVRDFNKPTRQPFAVTPRSFVLFPVLSMFIVVPAVVVTTAMVEGELKRPGVVVAFLVIGVVLNGLFIRHLRKPIDPEAPQRRWPRI